MRKNRRTTKQNVNKTFLRTLSPDLRIRPVIQPISTIMSTMPRIVYIIIFFSLFDTIKAGLFKARPYLNLHITEIF